MNETVIQAENLGKRYRLGANQVQRNLRETITHVVASPFQRVAGGIRAASNKNGSVDHIWALKDVSFSVQQGEVLGIIGRNGAGKSTLLKILSRITKPTEGYARIRGRVGSLLEVGTGFHPELTGRENVYLSGAILGMTRAEIERKFDEIVAFAEVEKFLDTPVKHYSSGMYLRLAFAVAAHLEPEILIVDEVLAVGDAEFQRKCLGKMKNVAGEGRTVLFVSHNLAAISQLCSSALALDRGQIICRGNTSHCIATYIGQFGPGRSSNWLRPVNMPEKNLTITEISSALRGEQPHLSLELEILLESRARHKAAFVAIDILDATGTAIMQALPKLEGFLTHGPRQHTVKITIELPPLIPGQYYASVWVGSHNTETLDEVEKAVTFEVHKSPTPGRTYPHTKDHGYIVPASSVISGLSSRK